MNLTKKLSSLKASINVILDNHKSRCLWWSGGADSQFLLEIMLETKKKFGILRFEENWSKKQRTISDKVIIKHNLQVFSYPAQSYLLIGKDEQVSLVSAYLIDGNHWVPNIRDLVDGDSQQCGIDLQLKKANLPYPPIQFDCHIWGSRFDDKHYAFEHLINNDTWRVGNKLIICPLAEWTREEVLKGLKTYGIDYQEPSDEENTGNLVCCHNCLKSKDETFCPKLNKNIPPFEWNKEQNLKDFQASLG
jgi:hypothetical protein